MYSCANCGEKFDKLPEGIIRCPACAFKILYKERAPVAKKVRAK